MKNRRFVLVIMDSTGRSLRRVGVSRRLLEVAVIALSVIAITAIVMSIHAVVHYDDAVESQQMRAQNEELTELITQLEAELPNLRRAKRHGEMTFAQLWSKSGLGLEPRLLAVGPHEAGAGGTPLPSLEDELASAVNGDLLALDPVALTFESERIHGDARTLDHSLAELLEYFHDAERVLSHTPSVRPTASPWLTSSFGRRRDPIYGTIVMHKGLDMGGFVGMPITAPADGVVIFAGRRGGYGQTVVIDHGYGIQTHYAHLSRFRVGKGRRVQRGDLIADMGSTGKSTGPHLHYEVRRVGQPMDPRRFILD